MIQNILFVINPIAGGVDKKDLENTIESWAQSSGVHYQVFKTSGQRDEERLRNSLRENRPEVVLSVGGDGTLKMCAELLRDTDIGLAMIPMGSANGMASELDIPNGLEANLELLSEPNFERIDLLCFNDSELGLHISDLGLNAELVRDFEESGRRGFFGYAENLYNNFTNQQEFEVEIETEQQNYSGKAVMVALANAKTYGTGAKLNQLGKLNDGLMEICVIKKLSLGDLAEHVITIPDEKSDHMEIIQCKKARLRTSRKVAFQIDGEVRPATDQLKVEVLARNLKILLPPSS